MNAAAEREVRRSLGRDVESDAVPECEWIAASYGREEVDGGALLDPEAAELEVLEGLPRHPGSRRAKP